MLNVTTIIPTMAEDRRHQSLLRAIESIRSASADPVQIVVVVNGSHRSDAVLKSLSSLSQVRILSLDVGSLPLAQLEGRRAVDTPYFSFLDDDDEYLPGAIDLRLKPLEADHSLDFSISNGYRNLAGNDVICFSSLDRVAPAPFEALFQENWLASCGALFRSSSIGAEYFEKPHAYVEWTWLAFKLCLDNKKLATISEPTFRIHDTPDSASKSPAYSNAISDLYQRMLRCAPPRHIRTMVLKRIGASLHSDANSLWKQGCWGKAWEAHLKSLFYPGGWRYLTFSRHLLFPSTK